MALLSKRYLAQLYDGEVPVLAAVEFWGHLDAPETPGRLSLLLVILADRARVRGEMFGVPSIQLTDPDTGRLVREVLY